MSKKVIIAICILGIIFFHFTCTKHVKESKENNVKAVKTMIIGSQVKGGQYQYPGKVEAFDDSLLAFNFAGKILQFPIQRGEIVEKGQLIAQLDPRDYENDLTSKKAQFTKAKAELDRYRGLYEDNAVALADLEVQERNFDVARAELEISQKAFNDTMLEAPFAGVIAEKFVNNFENVQAKESVVRLQNLTTLKIEINVPETDVGGKPKEKQDLQANAIFDVKPDEKFPLKLYEWDTMADKTTHTYKVNFVMPSPETVTVLPGMTASVTVKYKYSEDAPSYFYVPSSAVFSKDDSLPCIWVVNKDSMVVSLVHVEVEDMSKDQIKVTKGLKGSEMIVTAGVYALSDGDHIRSIQNIYKGE